MSRINPFKNDGLKVTNRFSMLEEKEAKPERKEEKEEKFKKAEPYSRVNNSFLRPQLQKNAYYYAEEPTPEKTLSPSDFPELLIQKKATNTENKNMDFATKLLQKNEVKKNEVVEVKDVEEDMKQLNVCHTPMDTLNALCELYAYQERWGRYWYGSEAYDEMYGIDRSINQYDMDYNDWDYDDASNDDDDDDDN